MILKSDHGIVGVFLGWSPAKDGGVLAIVGTLDNQVQVLKMIEKSFNQTRNIDDKENDNSLGKFL